MEKIIPRAINYSDIKPEAIENQIKMVRFTPTATINAAKANDIVRFQLQGNGFYDPYSAYLKIEVTADMAELLAPTDVNLMVGRFLDRSAHSLISRLVVRSQGVELERIEQYDILAAMINDMLYSQEQCVLHHCEGFPTTEADFGGLAIELGSTNRAYSSTSTVNSLVNPVTVATVTSSTRTWTREHLGAAGPIILSQGMNQKLHHRYLADRGFWKMYITTAEIDDQDNTLWLNETLGFISDTTGAVLDYAGYFGQFATVGGISKIVTSPKSMSFCIPLYSGILGVLMQDKKMLPLSLMPLEVEFTLNPYAFYGAGAGTDNNPRGYQIDKFWLYSHVLFFEQELHRSLEAVVAENGIFIHFNSFYLAPITTHAVNSIAQYAQINVHAKSINSIHFVFIYSGYEGTAGVRKLAFQNHHLETLQVRNGQDLYPSEPIEGKQGTKKSQGEHAQFLLETFKAYGKLHDPTTDAGIDAFSYVKDKQLAFPTNLKLLLQQQAQLGRCQYAVSFEGEELGMDKTLITGKRGMVPFDINMTSSVNKEDKVSYQFIFVRADYIVYVRPDLVVNLLGR